MRALALLAVCFALASDLDAAQARSQRILRWRGKVHALDQLPALGDAPRAAIEAWSEFARERGYRMELEDEGRVLLLAPDDSLLERSAALVRRAVELFERELPPPPRPRESDSPPRPAASGARASETGAGELLPEDPEGPPPRWKPPVTVSTIPDYEWGRGTIEPDVETATMLVLRDMTHYHAVLELLVRREAYLAGWAKGARAQVGFVLERPLCGSYVLKAEGQEEWNPDNELVHRVASLLLLRRFGQQPWWLLVGYSWHAEIALLRGVYCFPHRDEFVWATEHEGWDRAFQKALEARKAQGLDFALAAGWKRGTWKAEAAHVSWGLVDGILRLAPGRLSALLDELRRFRDAHDKRRTSDTTWERIPDYEIPVADQRRMLLAHLGQDFLERLAADVLAPRRKR